MHTELLDLLVSFPESGHYSSNSSQCCNANSCCPVSLDLNESRAVKGVFESSGFLFRDLLAAMSH